VLDKKNKIRLAKYAVVGLIGFVLQWAGVRVLKEVLPARIAFTMAFAIATGSHYTLNRFWALKSTRRDGAKQLVEYLGTVCVSYLVSFTAFNFFFGVVKMSVMWSTVLSVPPSTLVVFLLLNYRVFHHKHEA
jgi:putative flippase GtrA